MVIVRAMSRSRPLQRFSRISFVLTTAGLIALNSVRTNAVAEEATAPIQVTLLEVVDATGNTPSAPSSLLYEGHTPAHEPVLAPPYNVDPSLRQHLTLNDFDNVGGTGHIERVAGGTQLTLQMTGLIPHGVYSVWSDFYKAPGLTPDFANSIAFGAFGNPDGSENTFVVGSDGTAFFQKVQPPGPMSISGVAPTYALDPPVSDFIAFLAYHINGQTYGGEPAPAGLEQTFVVQGMADFVRSVPEPGTAALLPLGWAALAVTRSRALRRNTRNRAR
jgi:hypothetical protein